ncbi:pseudoazurin [Sneathiella chinensis]|uniref:Pseudoazurin n=1 Tax=Sneathiella chinensis TaxID=349750 RepID=A0ABQ5U0J0_9PROT|nr:pseudoazurin [Sneathiella chinensis]GLQ05176.1 pseudoazurin [Sneathiella chinensis]
MKAVAYIITLLLLGMTISVVQAAEYEVKMLNRGEKGVMVFEPDFVKAEVGDVIRFVPTDKGHNVESIKGMLPKGAETFRSAFNEEYALELTEEGFYGIKCSPHYPMGMVALISVGTPNNTEQAKKAKNPPKARKLFEELFKGAEGQN